MEKVYEEKDNIILNNNNDVNENVIPKSKKDKKKESSMKKMTKAINCIVHHEGGSAIELFQNSTQNFYIYHFGNGDEDDYELITKILKDSGVSNFSLNIFPGISYCFIEFKNKDEFLNFSKICKSYEILNNINVFNFPVKAKGIIDNNKDDLDKERPILFFPTNRTKEEIKLFKVSNLQVAKFTQTENYNVPGLHIFEDIISEEEEKMIVEELDKCEWKKMLNREVQHYGYEFLYGKNNINKENKITEFPSYLSNLLKKIEDFLLNFRLNKTKTNEYKADFFDYNSNKNDETNDNNSFFSLYGMFNQLTVNKYRSGDGIPPHVDSHEPFNDIYCSLSLLSGTVMVFSNDNQDSRSLYLKPRSIAFFTNEVRYDWEHSIPLRKVDLIEDTIKSRKKRISLTFRKVRNEFDCKCVFTSKCDSYKKKNSSNANFSIEEKYKESDKPTDIEKKLVYEVYEKIAPHFSHTRYKPWPHVVKFLESLEPYSIVGDIGCGNGKYLSVVKNLITIGTDRSFNLSTIAAEKNPNSSVFVSDSLILPFRDNSLDAAISIAVIHHFCNDKLRLRALNEITRIIKKDGLFLVYVWAFEQDKVKFDNQENLVAWHLQDTYTNIDDNNTENEIISDKNTNENTLNTIETKGFLNKEKRSVVYHRYYHMFKEKELEALINQINNIEIIKSYYDHENWCCICKKLK